jgi:4,5-DOPA dioxygenase extradiol
MGNEKMPVLFVGHGSPVNAISSNAFTSDLKKISALIPLPKAVLVISSHWLTSGTRITSGNRPEQIYDFYGFPEELYRIRYSPPGSPETVSMICNLVKDITLIPDNDRGIDHAAWAVLRHIFPDEKIPVLELSLDMNSTPEFHYKAGKSLSALRENGILILCSGNIVHNLMIMDYYEGIEPYDWALEFDEKIKQLLMADNHLCLIHYDKLGKMAKYAVPTDDHYVPLLYAAALKQEGEAINFFHESIQHGSISMRSFIIQ